MRIYCRMAILVVMISVADCVTLPRSIDKHDHKAKTPAERYEVYKDNGIIPGSILKRYRVGQEKYAPEELSPLFAAPYVRETTRNRYLTAGPLNTIASFFAAVGGFMIGWNVGAELAGSKAILGLWVGGGGSILFSFFFAGMADRVYTDASIMYNNDLYDALELRQKVSAVKPQEQYPHYTMSMAHAF